MSRQEPVSEREVPGNIHVKFSYQLPDQKCVNIEFDIRCQQDDDNHPPSVPDSILPTVIVESNPIDYSSVKRTILLDIAKQRKLKAFQHLKKHELIKLLSLPTSK